MVTSPGILLISSNCMVVFFVWEPMTTMPPFAEVSVTISFLERSGLSLILPMAFTKAAAVLYVKCFPCARAR